MKPEDDPAGLPALVRRSGSPGCGPNIRHPAMLARIGQSGGSRQLLSCR